MKKTPILLFLVFLLVISIVSAIEKISVDEGTLIKLNVEASDPDGDRLEYIFPEPFDEKGEWQTNYTDAGEYLVNLAVSDGKETTYKEFVLKIKDKDRAPEFKNLKNSYSIKENNKLEIELEAEDPDGDSISFEAINLPQGAVFEDNVLTWKPGYETVFWEDAWQNTLLKKLTLDRIFKPRQEVFKVRFVAKGKELETAKDITIKVKNTNRRPVMDKLEDMTVYEGEEIILDPTAADPDDDRLVFSFSGSMNSDSYITKYDDEGDYEIKVKVSDGELSDTQIVHIAVKNTNRAPELSAIAPVSVRENQTIRLELKAKDPDDDQLTYSSESIPEGAVLSDNIFIWTPGFDAAGEYKITFTVKDAKLESEHQETIITVKDRNRKPVINDPAEEALEIFAGETVKFTISATDPDGDNITYSWKFGLLENYEGTSMHSRTFTMLGDKKVRVTVSDSELKAEKIWNITVVERPVVPVQAKYLSFTVE